MIPGHVDRNDWASVTGPLPSLGYRPLSRPVPSLDYLGSFGQARSVIERALATDPDNVSAVAQVPPPWTPCFRGICDAGLVRESKGLLVPSPSLRQKGARRTFATVLWLLVSLCAASAQRVGLPDAANVILYPATERGPAGQVGVQHRGERGPFPVPSGRGRRQVERNDQRWNRRRGE